MLVFGTRPEAIKMAPLVLAMKKAKKIEPIVVTTGQHKEMLEQVMSIFGITSDYDMAIMQPKQTLSDITAKVLDGMKIAIARFAPDMVLVHGDTTTSIAAALGAFYQQVPIGHVEAGLRTNDKYSPFPEEMNRQLTGRLADLHFAPTNRALANLQSEGTTENVYVTGNTSIDAVHYTTKLAYQNDLLDQISDNGNRMMLMTIHRRENLEINMENIFKAIKDIVERRIDVEVVFPMHLNPRVQKAAKAILGNHERIHLIQPLDVVGFHHFMNAAHFIVSDSGGVQEEAPSLAVPVLVARDTTERPEGVAAGNLKLVGVNPSVLISESLTLLDNEAEHTAMSQAENPYGDGLSSQRITKLVEDYLVK